MSHTKINTVCTLHNSLALKDELLQAALSIHSMQAYCAFAFQRLHEFLQMDSASLNLAAIESDMQLEELSCYFYQQPRSMAKSYQAHSQEDFFSPLVIARPGTPLQGRTLFPGEQYYDTAIFKNH